MKGVEFAVITALPTTSAATVASMKLLTAAPYSATRRFVVRTMKLKPTKKKIVGGNALRSSCSIRTAARRGSEDTASARPADGAVCGSRLSCRTGSLFKSHQSASRCYQRVPPEPLDLGPTPRWDH